tara:strand:+ start:71 stop:454 length:384 start_codon:yes stop_codon:yes gene_type:complete
MRNLRRFEKDPIPSHKDFQWLKSESENDDLKKRKKYLSRLREMNPDFGILRWGTYSGRRYEYNEKTHAHIYWIKDTSDHGKVSEILASINYSTGGDIPHPWMGAPNFCIEHLIEVYETKKNLHFTPQ